MRKSISLLAGLALFLCSQAQTNQIKHMDISIESIHEDSIAINDMDTMPVMITHHKANMLVDLGDTINITSIEITLGTTEGSGNLITKSFDFGNEGTFTDGTSYNREGNLLNFGLGLYNPLSSYYGSVRLHLENGSYSSPLYFSIQY
jgi:hypothetical protein